MIEYYSNINNLIEKFRKDICDSDGFEMGLKDKIRTEGLLLLLEFLLLCRNDRFGFESFYRLGQISIDGKRADDTVSFLLPIYSYDDEKEKALKKDILLDISVRHILSAKSIINNGFLESMITDNVFRKENIKKMGPSDRIIEHYEDDPMLYGRMDKDHKNKHVDRILSLIKTISEKYTYFIEIGCANGYLLNKLSALYPENDYIGLDFHMPDNNFNKNVNYTSGYPLDYFDDFIEL